jgi:hypothetical protein
VSAVLLRSSVIWVAATLIVTEQTPMVSSPS